MPLTAPASFKRVHARGLRVRNAGCRAHLGMCCERHRALHRVGRVLHHLDRQPHAAPRAQRRAAGPARRARGACRIRSGPGVLCRPASGRARRERQPVGLRQAQPERRIRGVPRHHLPLGGQLSRGGRWRKSSPPPPCRGHVTSLSAARAPPGSQSARHWRCLTSAHTAPAPPARARFHCVGARTESPTRRRERERWRAQTGEGARALKGGRAGGPGGTRVRGEDPASLVHCRVQLRCHRPSRGLAPSGILACLSLADPQQATRERIQDLLVRGRSLRSGPRPAHLRAPRGAVASPRDCTGAQAPPACSDAAPLSPQGRRTSGEGGRRTSKRRPPAPLRPGEIL
jgi:hypothetical protein